MILFVLIINSVVRAYHSLIGLGANLGSITLYLELKCQNWSFGLKIIGISVCNWCFQLHHVAF